MASLLKKSDATKDRERRNKDSDRILRERGPVLSTPNGGVPKSSAAQKMRAKLGTISRRDSTPTATKKRIEKLQKFLTIYKPDQRQYKDAFASATKIVDSSNTARGFMRGRKRQDK